MYQHDRLHRSRLVRLLQNWAQPTGSAQRQDVAEQLSQWLSTVAAVQLSRALHALETHTPPAAGTVAAGDVALAALDNAVQRAQEELASLLAPHPASPRSRAGRARADNTPVTGPDPAAEGEFAVHAARYQAAQKQAETRVASLRAQVRQQLALGSSELRRLAMLDAVMEQVLCDREQRLLATLVAHLEKRMADLRRCHEERLRTAGEPDAPEQWRLPGGWLAVFESDARDLLQCEVALRMQPVHGLLAAARSHAGALRKMPPPPPRQTEPHPITGMIE